MTVDSTAVSRSLRETYYDDGFVTAIRAFSVAEIETIRRKFDELEARLGREKCATGLLGRHRDQQFIWDMVTSPALLDKVQEAVGDDLLLLETHFFCKYPETRPTRFVAWHQDVTYWGIEPREAHTAWIAIDDADVENGCMQVVRGSHKLGQLPHGKSDSDGNLLSINQEVPEEYVDLEKSVCLELAAGMFSIHHGLLLHASQPNKSQRRRCGLTVRFIPPYVRQVGANSIGTTYQPYLIRGTDNYRYYPRIPYPFPFSGP